MANNEPNYTVVYRDVKHPRLEFKTGSLLVVLPKGNETPEQTLEKHSKWIKEKQQIIQDALKQAENRSLDATRTEKQLEQLATQTIQKAQASLHTTVGDVYFRKMRSKWASLSKNNNLTLNSLLKYLPAGLIEYVIFHEVVHAIERKHNGYFWGVIARQFPDYIAKEKELLIYWFLVQLFLSESEKIKTLKNPKGFMQAKSENSIVLNTKRIDRFSFKKAGA